MSILGLILRLQQDPPIPLSFSDIYGQLQQDDPNTKLTKTWVHRILKMLTESKLVRLDNPDAKRKKYIADVNTIMSGFEEIKSKRIETLETQNREIKEEIEKLSALDCGQLSKEFVKGITGRKEEVSSRIVRGVDELHRLLRYNMLDIAGEGDTIRATALWVGPFVDDSTVTRTMRFVEAAERGADIRYLFSTEIFNLARDKGKPLDLKDTFEFLNVIGELRERGKKFDMRLYAGPNTYNQISFNRENMALVITENPITATWMTRTFNPDLIDNAVTTFDKDWSLSVSVFDLTPKDYAAFGIGTEVDLRKLMSDQE